MTQQNLDAILKRVQAEHPGRKIRIAESLPVDHLALSRRFEASSVNQEAAYDFEALIPEIAQQKKEGDAGVGATALRILIDLRGSRVPEEVVIRQNVRKWLKFWSCNIRQAAELADKMWPY